METMTLQTTAELLGVAPITVKRMVGDGRLQAVYPKTGKNGRPSMMITSSSYGTYLLTRKRKRGSK